MTPRERWRAVVRGHTPWSTSGLPTRRPRSATGTCSRCSACGTSARWTSPTSPHGPGAFPAPSQATSAEARRSRARAWRACLPPRRRRDPAAASRPGRGGIDLLNPIQWRCRGYEAVAEHGQRGW